MGNIDPLQRRNLTPPDIAKQLGVATGKVLGWIRTGELKALNLANRGCRRPRYSVSPEALEEFERARAVVPNCDAGKKRRLRRQNKSAVKNYF
jgi:hypothetical protein